MQSVEQLLKNAPTVDLFPELDENERIENRLSVEIAQMIYSRRRELGMSQKEFAAALHVSRSTVSRWENADCNFSVRQLAKIASLLQMSLKVVDTSKDILTQYYHDMAQNSGPDGHTDERAIRKNRHLFSEAA